MHCQNCRCLVTQAEADEANEIYPAAETHCPACATRFASDADKREEIVTALKTMTLSKGEAVYLIGGEIVRGKDGCQPNNSACLLVGDWDGDEEDFAVASMDWIDWDDVEAAIDAHLG